MRPFTHPECWVKLRVVLANNSATIDAECSSTQARTVNRLSFHPGLIPRAIPAVPSVRATPPWSLHLRHAHHSRGSPRHHPGAATSRDRERTQGNPTTSWWGQHAQARSKQACTPSQPPSWWGTSPPRRWETHVNERSMQPATHSTHTIPATVLVGHRATLLVGNACKRSAQYTARAPSELPSLRHP